MNSIRCGNGSTVFATSDPSDNFNHGIATDLACSVHLSSRARPVGNGVRQISFLAIPAKIAASVVQFISVGVTSKRFTRRRRPVERCTNQPMNACHLGQRTLFQHHGLVPVALDGWLQNTTAYGAARRPDATDAPEAADFIRPAVNRPPLLKSVINHFVLAVVALLLATETVYAFSPKYDPQIQSAVKRWWPDLPTWKLWKAQLYQESKLDPKAVSPVGARGLAQFMPGTWNDVASQMGVTGTPHDDTAIEAGAYYMAKLRATWKRDRAPIDRHDLAAASYNAGTGNVLKAQRFCGDANLWAAVGECMHLVTGEKNADETKTYVTRIHRWWREMEMQ